MLSWFILLTFVDFYKLIYNDTNGPFQTLLSNFNDFINNGVSRDMFLKIVNNQSKVSQYNKIVDLISNESLILSEYILESHSFSNYFNLSNSLYLYFPTITEFISQNKEFFLNLQPIFNEFASEFSKITNIESNTIKLLYNYVLINKENDDVVIEKLLNILKLPSAFFPKIQKILSIFDSKQPISEFFEGTNSISQYQIFIKKVKDLRVPDNNSNRFFSIIKVIDAFSSALDVIQAISQNFISKFYQEFLVPLINSYIIKPLDIFDVSIYERSTSFINIITKIQDYSEFCIQSPNDNNSINLDNNFNCTLYEYIDQFLSTKIKIDEDSNNTIIQDVIEKISIFTNDEVNLTDVLINDFNFTEHNTKFIFNLIFNLTDSRKSYLNVMESLQKISQIKNLTNAIYFINNINESSNMKYLFECLNGLNIWFNLTDTMCDFSNDKRICEYSFMKNYIGENKCENLMSSINELSKFLITNNRIQDIDKKYRELILNFILPAINEIDKPFSIFLKSCYQLITDSNEVDFSNLIKKGANLLDDIITVVDDLIPDLLKRVPIISYFYSDFVSDLHKIFRTIKTDGNIASIFDSIHEGGSVIIQMLQNGANSFVDTNTTVEEITRGIKPTTFIDVYQTAIKISSMDNDTMKIKRFADSITYESANDVLLLSDSKFNFNDVFPFKYFVLNSDEFTDSMQNGYLSSEFLAKGFGNEYNDLEMSLKAIIESALCSPRKDIKELAVNSGYDSDFVDAYLNAISKFSNSIVNGENILTKSNEYIIFNKKKKSLSGGAIAGIVIGVITVLGLAAFAVIYFYFNKKNKYDDKTICLCAL